MRFEIESREVTAQMQNGGMVDLSQPFGHVIFMEAVVYDDAGERLHGTIEACQWYRNGKPIERDPALGECPPWELRIDAMRRTEVPGAEDLYQADVTLKD